MGSKSIHLFFRLLRGAPCQTSIPNTSMAQIFIVGPVDTADVRAVVVTVMVSGDTDVGLRVTVLGTEHVAPAGAPEHVIVAVPLTPVPPITRLYVVVPPAVTVPEVEPPEATESPSPVKTLA